LDLGFTRTCESRLDSIGEGELNYQEFLLKFWAYLREQIQKASRLPLPPQKSPPPKQELIPTPKTKSSKKKASAVSAKTNCPKCTHSTKVEESKKWAKRYFHCCHSCRMYLETNKGGTKNKGDWISAGS